MAIPSNAALVYRIVAKANVRGGLAASKLNEVASAMNADTSGQYQLIHAGGNTIIYDWAPNLTSNASASILLRKTIEWAGTAFAAVSVSLMKGI